MPRPRPAAPLDLPSARCCTEERDSEREPTRAIPSPAACFAFGKSRHEGATLRPRYLPTRRMLLHALRLRASTIGPVLSRTIYSRYTLSIYGSASARFGHALGVCAGASLVTGASIAACAWKLEEAPEPTRWFQRRRPWGGGFGWAGDAWEDLAPLVNRYLHVSAATLTDLPGRWERLGVLGPLCVLNSVVYAAWWLVPSPFMRRHFLHSPLRGPPWTILLAAECRKLAPDSDIVTCFPCAEGACSGCLRRRSRSPWHLSSAFGAGLLATPSLATLPSSCTQARGFLASVAPTPGL